ncbi:oxygenase MpaB family protein [Nocardia sp. NPDC057353]|uniref:oxygenase MpaB family protein n=1 Tax=Nocardia sp. NPDC057353 TaxID=3346104 RepID=UPI00362DD411
MSIKSADEPAGAQPGIAVPPTGVEPVTTPDPVLAGPSASLAPPASAAPDASSAPDASRRVQPRPWGPDSMSWKRGIAWRTALASRATLLMQVAHPVVGAGVADHSEFLKDRWGRITSTAAAARRFSGLDGEQAALDEGARLRRLHRDIGGTDAKGRAYHALDPEAYLWVAATGYWAGSAIRRLHGAEFDAATEDQLYREWTDQARVLRIPERVIPAGRPEFWTWFDHIVNDVLERNWTTDLLIELDRQPMPPHPNFRLPKPIWNIPALPMAALLRLTTVGYLPPVLRERLGLTWDYPRAARFAAVVAVTDGLDRVLPERIRYPLSARTG